MYSDAFNLMLKILFLMTFFYNFRNNMKKTKKIKVTHESTDFNTDLTLPQAVRERLERTRLKL